MLHYTNIINDPYPDVRDPVTGDWLPKSYNDVKADALRRIEDAQMRTSMVQLLNVLK